MKWSEKKIKSSNIAKVGYDDDSGSLGVEFVSGGVYLYKNVPKALYTGMIGAKSAGIYFSANIRHKFESVLIDSGKEEEKIGDK